VDFVLFRIKAIQQPLGIKHPAGSGNGNDYSQKRRFYCVETPEKYEGARGGSPTELRRAETSTAAGNRLCDASASAK
jgi:hypothetical protein